MAELTEREYNLLLQAMTTNSSTMSSLNTAITTLRLELVEKYLTKREDRDGDDDLRDELLRLNHDMRQNLEQRIRVLQWVIVGQSATVLTVLGYLIQHFKT